MNDENEIRNKIIIILIIFVILVTIIWLIFHNKKDNKPTVNTNHVELNEIEFDNTIHVINKTTIIDKQNTITPDNNTQSNTSSISPIPLSVKGREVINGGELVEINNYKILIPDKLSQIGYSINSIGNTLEIKAHNNSYSCILMQLSDNYVMPKEEEINAFYETKAYKEWDNTDYDIDNKAETEAHFDKYSDISSNYYKSLGYTTRTSPDYTLTSTERKQLIGKYILEGDSKSSGSTGLFPGYKQYSIYDWGRYTLFTIPKYYKSSTSGEATSDFAICLYLFEYYDSSKVNFNVDLWKY